MQRGIGLLVDASYWDFLVYTMRRHIGRRGRVLSTLPACRGLAMGPFVRLQDLVPCGIRVALSRGRGRLLDVWKSRSKTGRTETNTAAKIQDE